MKCKFCGMSINQLNNGFTDVLNNEERRKLLKLRQGETICIECKTTVMMLDIISPF